MPAITTPPPLPTPFKNGSTFSFALNVPTTVAAGYFRGWEVQAQVRRKGDSSPKGLIGTHEVKLVLTTIYPPSIVNASGMGGHSVIQLAKTVSIENVSEVGSHKLAYGIRVSGIANVSECGQHSIRLGALLAPSIINDNHLGNHEIRIVVGENDKFIRDGGQWRAVETLLVKFDSQWHELDKILEKKDGVWVQIF